LSSEPKSLDVALNIAGVERIWSENLWLQSTLDAVTGWLFSNQFDMVSEQPYGCNTVDCELYFSHCCALKWTGTFALEGKVTYFF